MSEFPWFASYPQGVPHEIDPDVYPNLSAVLDESAKKFPNHVGYTNLGADATYAQMKGYAESFAAYLQSLPDMKPGDRIALMMPNLLQYVAAVFGILKAGMVVVNINPLYTPREVNHTLKDSGAKAIVVIENFARTVQKALDGAPCCHFITTGAGDMLPFPKGWLVNFIIRRVKKMVPEYSLPNPVMWTDALKIGRRLGFKPVEVTNDQLAFLQYTGGTTGIAKGAELTHRNVAANILQVSAWISSTFKEDEEVVLTALPLYHIFSLTATLVFTKWAATMVLITNPRDINKLVGECIKQNVSVIIGVNTLFAAMLRSPAQVSRFWKLTVSPNAAPPSAATFRALHGMARWAYQFHPLKSLSVATDSVIWVSALKGQIRPNTRVKFACAARKLCAATGKSLKKPPL